MKTILFFLLLSGIGLVSCKDEAVSPCDQSKPTQKIAWLRNVVNTQETEYTYPLTIYRCSYNGQKGFLLVSEIEKGIILSEFYDCSGALICQSGGIANIETCSDFKANAKVAEKIYP